MMSPVKTILLPLLGALIHKPTCVFSDIACKDGSSLLKVQLTTDSYPGETTWKVTDFTDSSSPIDVLTGGPYEKGRFTFEHEQCFHQDSCLQFTVIDEDGICCFYGRGSFKLFFAGSLIFKGGTFDVSSSSIKFGDACPSSSPSESPSSRPSKRPSKQPSLKPSKSRTPSAKPTTQPSKKPSSQPSSKPSISFLPTTKPSISRAPTSEPSNQPSLRPSISHQPSISPRPSEIPSSRPSSRPSFSWGGGYSGGDGGGRGGGGGGSGTTIAISITIPVSVLAFIWKKCKG